MEAATDSEPAMNEDITGETIWRGRLTEGGPPMRIVETPWGQFLQADDAADEPENEPNEKGWLF